MDYVPARTVVICKGLPASGKSSWARIASQKARTQRINKDDLRAMLNNSKFSRAKEEFVVQARDAMIRAALATGQSVIIDDTNFAAIHEQRIRDIVAEHNLTVEKPHTVIVNEFVVDPIECIRRDNLRPGRARVGPDVILRMYNKHVRKQGQPELKITDIPLEYRYDRDSGFVLQQDESLPRAIICDLDGTLAILNRNPFDSKRCETDDLNVPVANTLEKFRSTHKIILLSGRDDDAKPHTLRWLEKNGVQYDELHMRIAGDRRKDAVIKRELYENNILDKYYVEFILDDRDQVVDFWRRELGLTVFQVNYGDF
jgi:predicted kinase